MHDRILEERTGAAAVLFALDEEHALAMSYLADGVVDVERSGRGSRIGEVLSQVGVGEVGFGVAGNWKSTAVTM